MLQTQSSATSMSAPEPTQETQSLSDLIDLKALLQSVGVLDYKNIAMKFESKNITLDTLLSQPTKYNKTTLKLIFIRSFKKHNYQSLCFQKSTIKTYIFCHKKREKKNEKNKKQNIKMKREICKDVGLNIKCQDEFINAITELQQSKYTQSDIQNDAVAEQVAKLREKKSVAKTRFFFFFWLPNAN